jgi:hypothetical protein
MASNQGWNMKAMYRESCQRALRGIRTANVVEGLVTGVPTRQQEKKTHVCTFRERLPGQANFNIPIVYGLMTVLFILVPMCVSYLLRISEHVVWWR